jgi:hypothetical protein
VEQRAVVSGSLVPLGWVLHLKQLCPNRCILKNFAAAISKDFLFLAFAGVPFGPESEIDCARYRYSTLADYMEVVINSLENSRDFSFWSDRRA